MKQKRYYPALDGLRALAAIGVFLSHTGFPHTQASGIGIYTFFVLSGFLITGILLQEHKSNGNIGLVQFYARRMLRLFPALLTVVVVESIYVWLRVTDPERHITLHAIPSVLLYYANWLWYFHGVKTLAWFGHCWTLSVEEQFYFVWPLLLILSLRWLQRRAILLVVALGCIASFCFRYAIYRSTDDLHYLFGTHVVAEQLLAGCLLALCVDLKTSTRIRGAIAPICRVGFYPATIFLLSISIIANPTQWPLRFMQPYVTFGVSLIGVSSVIIIGALIADGPTVATQVLSWRPLTYLGRISYGFYLWHIPVMLALHNELPNLRVRAWVGLSFVLTVAAASLSHFAIEKPALAMRKYFEPTAR